MLLRNSKTSLTVMWRRIDTGFDRLARPAGTRPGSSIVEIRHESGAERRTVFPAEYGPRWGMDVVDMRESQEIAAKLSDSLAASQRLKSAGVDEHETRKPSSHGILWIR